MRRWGNFLQQNPQTTRQTDTEQAVTVSPVLPGTILVVFIGSGRCHLAEGREIRVEEGGKKGKGRHKICLTTQNSAIYCIEMKQKERHQFYNVLRLIHTILLSDTVSSIENTVTVYSYHSYSLPSRPSNTHSDPPRYSGSLNNEHSPFLNTNTKQAPYEKMGKLSSAKAPRQRDKQTQSERSRCLLSYPGRYWSHLLVLVGVTLQRVGK
ncbi:hypothetical protein CEXT_351561 [Caerostris extrusa]|uniref:Uncharacterized protein n=1 Tax=Caerostris extrusa TaxID=172846 RepID=A0AAV4UUU3_CAEEX|nr:hypothetical protein CEXT_351561 [Caerostris extrusa]